METFVPYEYDPDRLTDDSYRFALEKQIARAVLKGNTEDESRLNARYVNLFGPDDPRIYAPGCEYVLPIEQFDPQTINVLFADYLQTQTVNLAGRMGITDTNQLTDIMSQETIPTSFFGQVMPKEALDRIPQKQGRTFFSMPFMEFKTEDPEIITMSTIRPRQSLYTANGAFAYSVRSPFYFEGIGISYLGHSGIITLHQQNTYGPLFKVRHHTIHRSDASQAVKLLRLTGQLDDTSRLDSQIYETINQKNELAVEHNSWPSLISYATRHILKQTLSQGIMIGKTLTVPTDPVQKSDYNPLPYLIKSMMPKGTPKDLFTVSNYRVRAERLTNDQGVEIVIYNTGSDVSNNNNYMASLEKSAAVIPQIEETGQGLLVSFSFITERDEIQDSQAMQAIRDRVNLSAFNSFVDRQKSISRPFQGGLPGISKRS